MAIETSFHRALCPRADASPARQLVAVSQQVGQISYGRKCYRTWAIVWRYSVRTAQRAGGPNVRINHLRCRYRGLRLNRLLAHYFQYARMWRALGPTIILIMDR